jgi:hypothetical protein
MDATGDQLDALRKIVCYWASSNREVIAYGTGWSGRDANSPSATPAAINPATPVRQWVLEARRRELGAFDCGFGRSVRSSESPADFVRRADPAADFVCRADSAEDFVRRVDFAAVCRGDFAFVGLFAEPRACAES